MKIFAAWWRGLGNAFKRSLQLRVVTVTVVLGIAMVTVVGTVLTHVLSDAIQDQRVSQLRAQLGLVQARIVTELNDTTDRTAASKMQFLDTVTSPLQNPQISGAKYLVAYEIAASAGAGNVRGQFTEIAANVPTGVDTKTLISDRLLTRVSSSEDVQWQNTSITEGDQTSPAIVMGVQIPDQAADQNYAIFLFYSTQGEADTIALVQRTLIWAGAALIVLFTGVAFLGVRQVVLPVQQAARVARRVADGELDERMIVRGSDEMATLSTSFNDMALSLVDKIGQMEALTQHQQLFISDVAHELRTPITTIHMAADVIHRSCNEPDAGADPVLVRTSKLLVTQVERFESLLADLLEMSKFDAGAVELNLENSDVHVIVQRVIDMVTPVADRQRSWLRVLPAAESALAEVDSSRVERVIRNLVLNACEHSAGHPIDVEVGVNDDAVAVAVRDRGIGLSPDALQRVFDRFWRGDSSRKRTIGGTGLGLSIASKDAQLHHGTLDVWGELGRGAVFRLTLPRVAGGSFTESPLRLEQLAEDLSHLMEREFSAIDEPYLVREAITGEIPAINADATVTTLASPSAGSGADSTPALAALAAGATAAAATDALGAPGEAGDSGSSRLHTHAIVRNTAAVRETHTATGTLQISHAFPLEPGAESEAATRDDDVPAGMPAIPPERPVPSERPGAAARYDAARYDAGYDPGTGPTGPTGHTGFAAGPVDGPPERPRPSRRTHRRIVAEGDHLDGGATP